MRKLDMVKYKTLILSLEWHSYSSRDREIITPVINYLRLKNYTVYSEFILDYTTALYKYKPNVVLFSNVVGSEINYTVAKYCKSRGVRVISLISEGYAEELTDGFFFPKYSNCKIDFVDLLLVWNKSSLDYLEMNHPDIARITSMGGNTGIDRFVFSKREVAKGSFQRSNNSINKIITIALTDWTFWYSNDALESYPYEIIKLQKDSRDKFHEILNKLILRFQDWEFWFRRHPGSNNVEYFEGIEGLLWFDNVKLVKNELSLIENIDLSHYWIAFDSTTAMEAQIRGVIAMNLRPFLIPNNFLVVKNEAIYMVRDFFSLEKLISNTKIDFYFTKEYDFDYFFGKTDGLNHVRTVNLIIRKMNQWTNDKYPIINSNVSFRLIDRLLLIKLRFYHLIYNLIPTSIKSRSYLLSKRYLWDYAIVQDLERLRLEDQMTFYKLIEFNLDDL